MLLIIALSIGGLIGWLAHRELTAPAGYEEAPSLRFGEPDEDDPRPSALLSGSLHSSVNSRGGQ